MYPKHGRQKITGTLLMMACFLFFFTPQSTSGQVIGKGYNNSLIYKIKSDTNTVYILGSLHALAEDFHPFTRAFSYAYYDSQKIIMEVDPRKLHSPEGQKYMEKISKFRNGMTLKKSLSPKTYSLLRKHLKNLKFDIGQIKKYKPWKVYLMAGGKMFDAKKDFRAHLGVESYFFQMAQDAGKTMGGLETLEEHFNAFDKIPLKEQDKILREALVESLKENSSEEKEFIQLTTSWHQGNLKELEKVVEKSKSNPVFHKALLDNRNHKWIPQIEEFLKDSENYFVIVGVAHLPGEEGVLNLLSKKGYTLERVSFARP